MLLEHLIYSAALALIVGIVFMHYTKRDPTWIIILMTIAPDTDYVVNKIMLALGFNYPVIINHGDFHNLVGLTVFCVLFALVFHKYGVRFGDALICSIIGYVAHFVEDYIVYPPAYSYFYPFSFRSYGINLIPETANLVVVGTEVLIPGIIIFCIALYLRKMYDGDGLALHRYVIESIDCAKRIFVSKRYQEFL